MNIINPFQSLQDIKTPIPKIIYHYCTIEAFLNILKSSQIYLSSTKYMTDSLESKWILRSLEKIEKQKNRVGLERIYISNIRSIISRPLGGIYIACFSSHKDMLSQWRGFAKDGSGIAIGFNANALKQAGILNMASFSNLLLGKVLYDEISQEQVVNSVINYYMALINEEQEAQKKSQTVSSSKAKFSYERVTISQVLKDKNDYEDTVNLYIKKAAQALIFLSYLLKNNTFSEEDEYRICYYGQIDFLNDFSSDEKSIIIDALSFRTFNDKIIPYYPLNFNGCKNLIQKIIMGPKCQTQESTIRMVLKKYGYCDAAVFKSASSYR